MLFPVYCLSCKILKDIGPSSYTLNIRISSLIFTLINIERSPNQRHSTKQIGQTAKLRLTWVAHTRPFKPNAKQKTCKDCFKKLINMNSLPLHVIYYFKLCTVHAPNTLKRMAEIPQLLFIVYISFILGKQILRRL